MTVLFQWNQAEWLRLCLHRSDLGQSVRQIGMEERAVLAHAPSAVTVCFWRDVVNGGGMQDPFGPPAADVPGPLKQDTGIADGIARHQRPDAISPRELLPAVT